MFYVNMILPGTNLTDRFYRFKFVLSNIKNNIAPLVVYKFGHQLPSVNYLSTCSFMITKTINRCGNIFSGCI